MADQPNGFQKSSTTPRSPMKTRHRVQNQQPRRLNVSEDDSMKDKIDKIFDVVTQIPILLEKVNLISNELQMVLQKVTDLEVNYCTMRKEIDEMKTQALNSNQDGKDCSLEDFLVEAEERNQRRKNILITNVPESSASSFRDRISYDISIVKNIIQPILPDMTEFKVSRLGKMNVNSKRPRLLKVAFSGEDVAQMVLKNKKNLDESEYQIKNDLTYHQRQNIRKVYSELENRKQAGETNLRIKYQNNCPKIVKSVSHSKN